MFLICHQYLKDLNSGLLWVKVIFCFFGVGFFSSCNKSCRPVPFLISGPRFYLNNLHISSILSYNLFFSNSLLYNPILRNIQLTIQLNTQWMFIPFHISELRICLNNISSLLSYKLVFSSSLFFNLFLRNTQLTNIQFVTDLIDDTSKQQY